MKTFEEAIDNLKTEFKQLRGNTPALEHAAFGAGYMQAVTFIFDKGPKFDIETGKVANEQ